jgi:nucleotide-binding universal stress UspA family protein
MIPIRVILVPTDFSRHSEAALDRAVDFAKVFDAKIHLLHSHAIPVQAAVPYGVGIPDSVWDGIRKAAEGKLEESRRHVVSDGVEASSELSPALPTEAILAATAEIGADLIVMGTHGHTGLAHVLLGSVAERSIRLAPCSVLAVRGEEASTSPMSAIRKILAAVDFSEHADRALDTAVGLVKQFGAELHLVHAFDVPIPMVNPYEVAVPTAFLEEALQAAGSRLDALVQKLAVKGVAATSHLAEVPAASAIADLAEELGTDLIVMGTRGRTGLKNVLLGSVAERTLRHAPCSVLTVKRHPLAEPALA